jgi:hypothetical protein
MGGAGPMAALAPPSRPTPDHLALVRALIEGGQAARALELLAGVWPGHGADEHTWYLRLWALVGEGRTGDALDLTRVATTRLPGSAAMAYLQAVLAGASGDTALAQRAAQRAELLAPGEPAVHRLLEALIALDTGRPTPKDVVPDPRAPVPLPVDVPGGALIGAALLHPAGSRLPYRPVVRRIREEPAAEPPPSSAPARRDLRLPLVLVAVIVGALLAVWYPVPAALLLGFTAFLVGRRPHRRSGT